MKEFFVVLVVVILLIRALAKLGVKVDVPGGRSRKRATKPPRQAKVSRGQTKVPRGATHKSESASAKPGTAKSPRIRLPNLIRNKPTGGAPVQPPPLPKADRSETYVRYLLDVLRVGEPAASRHAVEKLVEMGKPALPYLQEASRDPSPFVRERVQQASRRILEGLALAGAPQGGQSLEEESIPLPPAPADREPRPALFDKQETQPELPPKPEPTPEPQAVAVPEPEAEREPEPTPEPDEVAEPVVVDGSDVEALAGVLRAAAAEPSFGGRRDELLEPLSYARARFTVVMARVQWTGAFGVSEDYRGGRTVGGRIQEVDLPVAVCLPKARNAYADALKDGDAFGFGGTFTRWDSMYDRGKFEGDLLEEPVAQE